MYYEGVEFAHNHYLSNYAFVSSSPLLTFDYILWWHLCPFQPYIHDADSNLSSLACS